MPHLRSHRSTSRSEDDFDANIARANSSAEAPIETRKEKFR